MSRTLFWYILRDLLRIFMMTVTVLAGIMAFGGLLKPLTEHGLSASQAAKVLVYFMPATQTYALPIAALFATTMVYGRLAADNELTACRASGISNLSLTMPALVLGLSLAIVSLLCLCFVAPHYMLKAEKVVFSNIAEVVKKKIERNHQLALGGYTIFANSAEIAQTEGGADDQVVILNGVMFVAYESPPPGQKRTDAPKPKFFYTADKATAHIRQVRDDVEFWADLEGGMKIDAEFGPEGASSAASFPPIVVPSPIREKTQFMDIRRLKDLTLNPETSRNVREQLDHLVRDELEREYAEAIYRDLNATGKATLFSDSTDDPAEEGKWIIERGDEKVGRPTSGQLTINSREGSQQIRIIRENGSRRTIDKATSAIVQVEAVPGPEHSIARFRVLLTLRNATLDVGSSYSPQQREFRGRRFSTAAPANLALAQPQIARQIILKPRGDLKKELDDLQVKLRSEIHGRASFAVSCLILVMIGCALGMLFKSGDFITAFAISAVPALLCIALISTGQHVGETSTKNLSTGIALIWSGNAGVLALVSVLLWKLQRQ